jgi:hypothetical protein
MAWGALIIIFAWLFASHAFADTRLRMAIPLTIAVIPQFTLLCAYVNNDIGTIAVSSITVYLWARIVRQGWTWGNCVFLGMALGGLILSKMSCYVLIPATVIFALLALRGNPKEVVLKLLAMSLIAVAVGGWWYVRSFLLYGDIGASGEIVRELSSLGLRPIGPKITYLAVVTSPVWWAITFMSFWAVFDYMGMFMHPIWYLLIGLGCILSLAGLVKLFKRMLAGKGSVDHGLSILLITCLVAVICSIAIAPLPSRMTFQPQGKYLLPVVVPVVFLIVSGLAGGVLFLCVLNFVALWWRLIPAYWR